MASFKCPERKKKYLYALQNWDCAEYIKVPHDHVRDALFAQFGPDADIERKIGKMMFTWAFDKPDRIDEVIENRKGWKNKFSHHFDMRLQMGGVKRYIETVLVEVDDEPTILVVNFHDA
ncbi:hypothetical protein COB72_03330 [bacterium]|nr:MAG: hypothetical protein COB72_03330 [bacterium]